MKNENLGITAQKVLENQTYIDSYQDNCVFEISLANADIIGCSIYELIEAGKELVKEGYAVYCPGNENSLKRIV